MSCAAANPQLQQKQELFNQIWSVSGQSAFIQGHNKEQTDLKSADAKFHFYPGGRSNLLVTSPYAGTPPAELTAEPAETLNIAQVNEPSPVKPVAEDQNAGQSAIQRSNESSGRGKGEIAARVAHLKTIADNNRLIFTAANFEVYAPERALLVYGDFIGQIRPFADSATNMESLSRMSDEIGRNLKEKGFEGVKLNITEGKERPFAVVFEVPEVSEHHQNIIDAAEVVAQLTEKRRAQQEEEFARALSTAGTEAGSLVSGIMESEDREEYLVQTASSRAQGAVNRALNAYLQNLGINSELAFQIDNEGELRPSGKILVPFINRARHTAYVQAGATASYNNREVWHVGAGYRYYPYAESIEQAGPLMLGVNAVYDYDKRGHQGFSVGGEVMTSFFLLAANYYGRLTGWKDSPDFGEERKDYIQERFAEGVDFRGKWFLTPWVPYLKNLALTYAVEKWYGDRVAPFGVSQVSDLEENPWIYSGGVEWQPVPALTLGFTHQQTAHSQTNEQFTLNFNLPLGYEIKDAFNPDAVSLVSGMDVASSRSMFIQRNYYRPLEYRATPNRYIITYMGPLGEDQHLVNIRDGFDEPASGIDSTVTTGDRCVKLDHEDGHYITDEQGNFVFEVTESCVTHTDVTVEAGEDTITFPVEIDKIQFEIYPEPEEIQRHETSLVTLDGGEVAQDIEIDWDLDGPGELIDDDRRTDSRGRAYVTYKPDPTISNDYEVTVTATAQGSEFECDILVRVYGNEPGDLQADPVDIDAGDKTIVTYQNLRPESIVYFKVNGQAVITVPPEFVPSEDDYPEVDKDEKPLRPEDYPGIVFGDGTEEVDPVEPPDDWETDRPGSADVGEDNWGQGIAGGTGPYVDVLVNRDGIARVEVTSIAATIYKDANGQRVDMVYDGDGNIIGRVQDGVLVRFDPDDPASDKLENYTPYSPDVDIPDREDETERQEVQAIQVLTQTEDPYMFQYAPYVFVNVHNYYARFEVPAIVGYGDEFEVSLHDLKPDSTVRFDDSEAHGLTRDGRNYRIRLVSAPLQTANSEGVAYATFKVSREYYDQENGQYYDDTYYEPEWMGYDKVSGIKAYYYRNYTFQEHEIRADAFTADANQDGSGDGLPIEQHQVYFDLDFEPDLLDKLADFSGNDIVTLCIAGGKLDHEVEWTVENATVIEKDERFDDKGRAYITIQGNDSDSGIVNVKARAMGNLDDLNQTLRAPEEERHGNQDIEWDGPTDGLTYKTWSPVIEDIQNTHIVASYSMEPNEFDVKTPQIFTLEHAKPNSGVVWEVTAERESGHSEQAEVVFSGSGSVRDLSDVIHEISYDETGLRNGKARVTLDPIDGFDVLRVTVKATYFRKSTEQREISKTFKVYDYKLSAEADRTYLDAFVYVNKKRVYDYTTVTVHGGRPGDTVDFSLINAYVNDGFDGAGATDDTYQTVFDARGDAVIQVMSKENFQGDFTVDARGVGDDLAPEVVLPYVLKEYEPQITLPVFTYYDGTQHADTIDYRTDYPITITGLMPGSPVRLSTAAGDYIRASGEPEGDEVFWATEGETGGSITFTLEQIADFGITEADLSVLYLHRGDEPEYSSQKDFPLDLYNYDLQIAVNKPELDAGGFRDGERFPDSVQITISNGRAGEEVVFTEDEKADADLVVAQMDDVFDEEGNAVLVYQSQPAYAGKEGRVYTTSASGVGDDSEDISFTHHFRSYKAEATLPSCTLNASGGLCSVPNYAVRSSGVIDYRTPYSVTVAGLIPGSPVRVELDKGATIDGSAVYEVNAPNEPTDSADGTAEVVFLLDDFNDFSVDDLSMTVDYYKSSGDDAPSSDSWPISVHDYALTAAVSKTALDANTFVDGVRQQDSVTVTTSGGRANEAVEWHETAQISTDLHLVSRDTTFDETGRAYVVYESQEPYTGKEGRSYTVSSSGVGNESNSVDFKHVFRVYTPQPYLPYCSYSGGRCSGTSLSARSSGRIDHETRYTMQIRGLLAGSPVTLSTGNSNVTFGESGSSTYTTTVPTTLESDGTATLSFTINSVGYSVSLFTLNLRYYRTAADVTQTSANYTIDVYDYSLSMSGVPSSIVGSECFTATVSGGRYGSSVSWSVSGNGGFSGSSSGTFNSSGQHSVRVCGRSPYTGSIMLSANSNQNSVSDYCSIRLNLNVDTIYILAGPLISPDVITISNGIPGTSIVIEFDRYFLAEGCTASEFEPHVERSDIEGRYTFDSDGTLNIKSKDYCSIGDHKGCWIRFRFTYYGETYYFYERFI